MKYYILVVIITLSRIVSKDVIFKTTQGHLISLREYSDKRMEVFDPYNIPFRFLVKTLVMRDGKDRNFHITLKNCKDKLPCAVDMENIRIILSYMIGSSVKVKNYSNELKNDKGYERIKKRRK